MIKLIKENVSEYIKVHNLTVSNFFQQEGVDCFIETRSIFKQVLSSVNYSLFIGSSLLLGFILLYMILEYYKNSRIQKLTELSKFDGVLKLNETIGMLQRLVLFACFVISAWLFQIAMWGL